MPSIRYTVRLPPALDAAVQERLRTAGTPFAVLIRDALSAYLADTAPTGLPIPADSTDTLRELQEKLADVTTRRTFRTNSHKPLNLLVISFMEHIALKNN